MWAASLLAQWACQACSSAKLGRAGGRGAGSNPPHALLSVSHGCQGQGVGVKVWDAPTKVPMLVRVEACSRLSWQRSQFPWEPGEQEPATRIERDVPVDLTAKPIQATGTGTGVAAQGCAPLPSRPPLMSLMMTHRTWSAVRQRGRTGGTTAGPWWRRSWSGRLAGHRQRLGSPL